MKRLLMAVAVIFGVSVFAGAVAGPPLPLLATNSTTGQYVGNSTFTVVDQSNVTAQLNFAGGTITGPITQSGGIVTLGGQANVIPFQQTLAQLNLLTATTGQMFACTNCVQSPLCISSGSVNPGSFVQANATGTFVGAGWAGIPHCL